MMEVSVAEKVGRLSDFFKLPAKAASEALTQVSGRANVTRHELLVVVKPEAALNKPKDSYGQEVGALINKIAGQKQRVVNGLNGHTTEVIRSDGNAEILHRISNAQKGPLIFYPIRREELVLNVRRPSVYENCYIFGLWELLCEAIANPRRMEKHLFLADGDKVLHNGDACVPAVKRENDRLIIEPLPEHEKRRTVYRSLIGVLPK